MRRRKDSRANKEGCKRETKGEEKKVKNEEAGKEGEGGVR